MIKKKDLDYTLQEEVITVDKITGVVDWEALFGRSKPLVVEIGCGNGHFLLSRAAELPDNNYIGIDMKIDRIIKGRMKEVKTGVTNVRWIASEAGYAVNKVFAEKSVSTFYMTFPDPWPKKKHHKHRLFQRDFVKLIHSRLTDDGYFTFITDHEGYYNHCLEVLSELPIVKIVSHDIDESMKQSVFGKMWMEENRSFFSFTIAKVL